MKQKKAAETEQLFLGEVADLELRIYRTLFTVELISTPTDDEDEITLPWSYSYCIMIQKESGRNRLRVDEEEN